MDKKTNIILETYYNSKQQTIDLSALEERITILEQKVYNKRLPQIKMIPFASKAQNRNYPLHQENIDLLEEVKSQNPYLMSKDIINTALFIGLTELKENM